MAPSAATTSSSAPAGGPAWTDPLLANPHAVQDKARRVHEMFSAIAPSYDLNNRLHSLGMDQHWRSVAVKMAEVKGTDTIVDVACGTGDLTLKFAKARFYLNPSRPISVHGYPGSREPTWRHFNAAGGGVIGIDFTYEMLPLARTKTAATGLSMKGPAALTRLPAWVPMAFVQGDALSLPLPDRSADIVSIAFGIRNVSDWGAAIDEFARVLRPGGRLIILEFSLPTNPMMRGLYNFYFRKIMPITATLISGDKSGAYKYLPESVNTFISREAMQDRMRAAGFRDIVARPMTFGICVCYKGVCGGNEQ
jgi:demethylmenaquinone methyltransferase/2-methoxy-6-polyprenyl-1,4-benzoquinol methylase